MPWKWPLTLGTDLYIHGDETPQPQQHSQQKARSVYCIFFLFLSFPKNFTLLLENPSTFTRGQWKNYVIYLDFCKAFDIVPHNICSSKL